MYNQRKAINVNALYDLTVRRKNIEARKLFNLCKKIYEESKIVDLSKVKVVYANDKGESEYVFYNQLPEITRQTVALGACLIGRWHHQLSDGNERLKQRFKLTCNPTDFWHGTKIFKNDDTKCFNMEELIEHIIGM